MMKTVTVGDRTSHGGKVLTGSTNRKVACRPVARIGDKCSCPKHGVTKIIAVSGKHPKTDCRDTAHTGAITACGAKILPSIHETEQGRV